MCRISTAMVEVETRFYVGFLRMLRPVDNEHPDHHAHHSFYPRLNWDGRCIA